MTSSVLEFEKVVEPLFELVLEKILEWESEMMYVPLLFDKGYQRVVPLRFYSGNILHFIYVPGLNQTLIHHLLKTLLHFLTFVWKD